MDHELATRLILIEALSMICFAVGAVFIGFGLGLIFSQYIMVVPG